MAAMPPVSDLYAGLTAKEAAAQHEEFTTALAKSASAPKSAADVMGVSVPAAPKTPSSAIAGILADESLTKSMSADVLSSLNSALSAQQTIQGDIVKDVTLTSPISTGLVAFDLEAPAKLIFPKMTPLRNKIARKKGIGTSHRIKVINAITGSETGVADKWAGITDASTETFGASTYNRGLKIGYAGYDRNFVYKQFSLSDNVPFSAQFQGQGYQDIRQLAQTTTLYAAMLFEEKALLMSRGVTGDGNIGAISTPTIASATARTKVAGEVGLTAGTYYFKTAADAGQFGASAVSSATAGIVVTAGQVVDVVINDVAGALGYEIFAGTTNANASLFYQGRTGYNTFVFGGAADWASSGTAATTVASDTSAYATGYDGILANIIGASGNAGGVVSRVNSALSTTNAGVEFQNVFATLYANVKADPDEILINGADRKQLSDAIKGSGTVGAYRLNLTADEANGVVVGDVVTGLHNEVTGKAVSLTVHPWMPQGNAAILSYTLPIPDSNVSEVWSVHNVQDYMAVEWPVVDFNYSNSVYFNNVLTCAAPQFNGLLQGIKAA
jgi:hypothetical protein